MEFYSKEEITSIYKKYFGKDKKLDLTNYPYYLEKMTSHLITNAMEHRIL